MPIASTIRHLRRLRPGDVALLVEALVMLAAASAAVRLLPFRRVTRLASAPRSGATPGGGDAPRTSRQVGRAVQAWARRVPWRAVCFQIGLATHWMLRRRGLDSVLHYGVGRDGDDALAAHVWVTLDGRVVVGEHEAAQFACLARFPAQG